MSEPSPTRLDADRPEAAITRLDLAPGRGDGGLPPQPHTTFNLPSALATDWQIVAPIPAGGAEAELLIVQHRKSGEQAVAKLYRHGIRPPWAALERLTGAMEAHIVRVLARGESDGIAYELMEYCRPGSLRDHMAAAHGDTGFARRVLEQLAPALEHLHGCGLIHRDLKPPNVLVRTLEPLDLVLTDFGISSLAEGTQHFTSTSRTVRYAPPEAMSGVLSIKADYWSLGMILLELLAGRHPFDGLSEAVINHQLLTRSIDVSEVADPHWQHLVRGLLLRDPRKRWGAAEVRAWLAGDLMLDVDALPADDVAPASLLRPYQIEDKRCLSAESLGLALIAHWTTGVKDLARGFVTAWLRDDLRDQNLVRFVLDLMDDATLTPDLRLLRLALRLVPDMPAVWRGVALDDESLADVVRRALAGERAAADFLKNLHDADALAVFAQRPRNDGPRLEALRQRWQARVAAFQVAEAALLQAEGEARTEDTRSKGVADPHDLMYGAASTMHPSASAPHALLLAPELAPEALAARRLSLVGVSAEIGDDAPWFGTAGSPVDASVDRLAALDLAAGRARDHARARREQRARERKAEGAQAQALRDELDDVLASTRAMAQEPLWRREPRQRLRQAYDTFFELHGKVYAAKVDAAAFEPTRRTLRRAVPAFQRLAKGLDRLDEMDRLHDIAWHQARGIVIAVVVVLFLLRYGPLILSVALLAGIGLWWHAWRWFDALAELNAGLKLLPPRVFLPEPARE